MFKDGGLAESKTHIASIHENWTPATFASYVKSLYCLDFAKATEPVRRFPNAEINLLEFIQAANFYQQEDMAEECVKVS